MSAVGNVWCHGGREVLQLGPHHDEVLTYAGRPIRTALEIVSGTGKATRVLARRGIAVTATDPDAAVLTELLVPKAQQRPTEREL